MKKGLAFIVVLLAAFCIYWFMFKKKGDSGPESKPQPIALKKHSEVFNTSVDKAIAAYLSIKDAFVEADTTKAKQSTQLFISRLDSIPVDELKKDTAVIAAAAKGSIADIRSNAVDLLSQTTIVEMRQDFRMITEMMYPGFFKTINYEGPKLYLQHCPMAFGEDHPGDWLSNEVEVVNPYLGKHDPVYKGGMLHCGEVKDTIKAQ